ncbi:MAG: hypothetical protein P8Y51_00340 [Campylobacterales bacterium]
MKTILLTALAVTVLHAAPLENSTVAHDVPYYKAKVRNTELIYSKDNLPFAQSAAGIETTLQPLYESQYGYVMDEPLYVGLISARNQIPNGFSTPYPNNRQINYPGGVLMVDYFASPSWLKTLLYHESAHNYQMNVKAGSVSRDLHDVFGNGWFFAPWFTLPNITESRFLLEGNAVLNESWHGNGGRLYSGRFKAATLQQARAGYLTPERVYNDTHYFLYGSHFYTLGGYYQYHLAETYGLQNVNAYWKAHSRDWFWPFFTNRATEASVGVDFDTAFEGWRKRMEAEAAEMADVEGDAVAATQFYTPLNSDDDDIVFIINPTGRAFPERIVYHKADGSVTRHRSSHIAGKVVKLHDGRYATQASAFTSPWQIQAGLFDDHGRIVDATQSRVVEGYLRDGTPVYFDVPGSFDQPQLYVGDTFYGRVNSSVYIDQDDTLYYFVQGEGKTRTLYRNRTPLCSIKGYYGNVSGVDSTGAVYFIANTARGSGLFRCHDGRITRAHPADTIFEARLIDDNHALAAVMGADAYLYKKIALESIDETPYEVTLFVEHEPYFHTDGTESTAGEAPEIGLDHPYHSLLEMHYSGTNIALGADSEAGLVFDLAVNFADPLTRNALSAYAVRNLDEYTLGGLRYANTEFFLNVDVSAYGVIDRPPLKAGVEDNRRDYGVIVQTALPFVRRGYDSATLRANYYQDYENNSREPVSAALDLMRSEQYGVSMFRNLLLFASPYAASDRGDTALGGEATFEYGLPYEFYLNLGGQYSHSDAASAADSHGIKVVRDQIATLAEGDPSTLVMPSLRDTAYVKSAAKGTLGAKKVLNLSAYAFTFPVSLRREALFAAYSHYALESFGTALETQRANEADAGIVLDTLWMNRLPVPITLHYLYNDNPLLAERHGIRLSIGLAY